jgi:Domain of unknown function (DUF6268)
VARRQAAHLRLYSFRKRLRATCSFSETALRNAAILTLMNLRPILHWLASFAAGAACLAALNAQAGEASLDTRSGDVLHEFLEGSLTTEFVFDSPMSWKGSPGSTSWREAYFFSPVWGHESGPWSADVSLDYALHNFELSSAKFNRRFHVQSIRTELDFAWVSKDSGWAVMADASPGFATDFEKGTRDEFNVEASAAIGYRWSHSLFTGVSAEYTRSYGRPRLLPGLIVLWQPSEHFHLEISPEAIEPQWRINERLRASLVLVPTGGSWAVASRDGKPSRLTFSGAKVGIKVEKRVLDKCWLYAEAGLNSSGNIKLAGSAPAPILNRDLKPAGYYGGGLHWDF